MDIHKHIAPQDNEANMTNANEGTSGFNKQYLQARANRQRQLDQARIRFDPATPAADDEDDGGMTFDGGGD